MVKNLFCIYLDIELTGRESLCFIYEVTIIKDEV